MLLAFLTVILITNGGLVRLIPRVGRLSSAPDIDCGCPAPGDWVQYLQARFITDVSLLQWPIATKDNYAEDASQFFALTPVPLGAD